MCSLYRLRKTKQKYILTDIRKQANRMTFGEVSRFAIISINHLHALMCSCSHCCHTMEDNQRLNTLVTLPHHLYILSQIHDDAYQDDLGFSTGNLGKGGVGGPVRGPAACC